MRVRAIVVTMTLTGLAVPGPPERRGATAPVRPTGTTASAPA